MTAPFVSELRTPDDVVTLGQGPDVLHVRVQAAELWDALRVDAGASDSVEMVKRAALEKFFPDGVSPAEFVVKVRGFEILNESLGLAESGIRDGSTLLLSWRRRRPVK